MKVIKYSAIIILAAGIVTGCNHKKSKIPELPAQELYDTGMKAFEDKDYKKSSEYFSEVFFQNPGSPITASSEMMNAYSLYKQGLYDDAIDVIDMFMKLRPVNENAPYMHYLKALCYYVQIESIKLEQSKSEKALNELELIIDKYPNSDYAKDALIKKELVLSHLAGKEMEIGRYYLNKKNPIAAVGRFQGVLRDYGNGLHASEAYYRLVETNLMLGLSDQASHYNQILQKKYPGTEWANAGAKLMN